MLVGVDDGLGAVAELELLQDAGDVGLDGAIADDEPGGNLGVGESAGEELEHLKFAGGELLELGRRPRRVRAGEEGVDQPPGDLRASNASPAATTRTASISRSGGSVLSRKPDAPALSAS